MSITIVYELYFIYTYVFQIQCLNINNKYFMINEKEIFKSLLSKATLSQRKQETESIVVLDLKSKSLTQVTHISQAHSNYPSFSGIKNQTKITRGLMNPNIRNTMHIYKYIHISLLKFINVES